MLLIFTSLFFLLINVSLSLMQLQRLLVFFPFLFFSLYLRQLNNHSLQLPLLPKQSININHFLEITKRAHKAAASALPAICWRDLSFPLKRKGWALFKKGHTHMHTFSTLKKKKKVRAEILIYSKSNTVNQKHLLISCKKRQPSGWGVCESGEGRDLFFPSLSPCIHRFLPPPVNADH